MYKKDNVVNREEREVGIIHDSPKLIKCDSKIIVKLSRTKNNIFKQQIKYSFRLINYW